MDLNPKRLSTPESPEPFAKRFVSFLWKAFVIVLKIVLGIYGLVVVFAGLGYFLTNIFALRTGSPHPTETQTEKLTDHSWTVYITPEQSRVIHLLERAITFGIPSLFVIAAFLYFVLGKRVPTKPSQDKP